MKAKFLLAALVAVCCVVCLPTFLRAQSGGFGSSPFNSTPFGNAETEDKPQNGIGNSSSSYSYGRCNYCHKYHYPTCQYCKYCYKYHYPTCPPTQNAPFDGGLTVLIGAGLAYGFKKAYNKKKSNAAENIEK